MANINVFYKYFFNKNLLICKNVFFCYFYALIFNILIMTKKLFYFIGLLIFLQNSVYSQSLKNAFNNYNAQKYEEAWTDFSKNLSKGKEMQACNYGIGLILCSDDYKRKNNLQGFRKMRLAYDTYNRQTPEYKTYCEKVYNFNRDDIFAQMLKVASKEYAWVKDSNTIPIYTWFAENFNGVDSLVADAYWRIALIYNDFREYQKVAKKFPNAPFTPTAEQLCKDQWIKIKDYYFEELDYNSMLVFRKNCPDYPYYTADDTLKMKTAKRGDMLALQSPYNPENQAFYEDFIIRAAPNYIAYIALQRMASPLIKQKNYSEAINLFKKFRDKFVGSEKLIDKTIELLKATEKTVKITPYPEAINFTPTQYAPVLTADSKRMYFCVNSGDNEDVYFSDKFGGKWQKAEEIKNFNTDFGNEAPLAVSADGNTLLIFRNAKIYSSEKRYYGWSELQEFTQLNSGTSWNADAVFSSDGNAILFASDRRGNIGHFHPHQTLFAGSYSGNSDIYVCLKNPDGTWGTPINLGSTINTPYADRSPYLAEDMKTLYFSSEGHAGLGSMDVYKSERLYDTSWTHWSEPINLGKNINTSDYDYEYKIASDGVTAYFTQFVENKSKICSIELPQELRPKVVAHVFGKVTDKNGKPLQASIVWEDLETSKQLGKLNSEPSTGNYFIALPGGKNYGYYVDCNGYYPTSGNLNTEKLLKGENIEHNIVMLSFDEIISGESVVLENIFFDNDKYDLKPQSFPELKRLAKFLNEKSGSKLEISGHTDNTGSAEHNKTLSKNRAEAVKNYLVSIGCDGSKISTNGIGSDKPIAPNDTPENRAKNRRVEFRVMEN